VQFAKVMSIPDTAMRTYAELVTTWTPAAIATLWEGLESGQVHPRDAKMRLASEIVALFHGAEAAERAEEHFRTVFQQRDLPPDMPSYGLATPTNIIVVLVAAGLTVQQRGASFGSAVRGASGWRRDWRHRSSDRSAWAGAAGGTQTPCATELRRPCEGGT